MVHTGENIYVIRIGCAGTLVEHCEVMKMNMEQQFNQIAKEYDANRKKFIPCFDDFYGRTTEFIAANICTPKRILDLGAGTGLLSAFWVQHFGVFRHCPFII